MFCIQFTSGTTGNPKGVVLLQSAVIKNGQHTGDALHLDMNDILCFAVPLFHCFGNVLALMSCLTHNTKMVLIDYYSPAKTIKAINKNNCSVFFGVPTMFIKIMQSSSLSKIEISILKIVVAGAVVNPTLMINIKKFFNAKYVISGYGLTECSPGCTISDIYDDETLCHSTVGKKFPEIEIKIIDSNEQIVSDGILGEVLVKGYNVSPGYYKNGKIVPFTDSNGWLHTGDLGICENDHYKGLGRKDEMIIKGGENIAPIEIENYMLTFEYIIDVAIIPIPDEVYGQEIAAGIIFKDDQIPENFFSDINKKLSHFKIPKYYVKFSNFPTSTSGKTLKREIKEIVLNKIQKNEAIVYGV